MNIIKFLDQFSNASLMSEKEDNSTSRRQVFEKFGSISKKLAIAGIPMGAAMLSSKKTFAQTAATTPTQALQLALTLEYLEDEFYRMGLDSGVIPAGTRDEKVFMQISKHELAHVGFLTAGLGSEATPKPTFDFTVGGAFDPFNTSGMVDMATSYAQFMALSQAFEDTGVRAYKGQAGNLMSAPDLLKAALQIHSVEARHASEVRRMRGLKGWITGNMRGAGMPEATQVVYDGEENTMQAGVDTSMQFDANAGSEAFDEPLTAEAAVTIASLFIVS